MASVPIPAATLVLFRDAGPGAVEHLFVERAGTMRFAAGALVFPGGRVDEGDRRLAARYPRLAADDAAARIAAVRETIEEAGVAIGLLPVPDLRTVLDLRKRLAAGAVFADVLAAHGLALDLEPLVPFARWCPNFQETRNFDTRFYLARVAGGAPAATVDATENVRLFWARAQSVLDDADAGRARIIFPTRRNLERLAMLGSFDAASAQAATIAPDLITPWLEVRDGRQMLCIPADRGYPVIAEPFSTISRN